MHTKHLLAILEQLIYIYTHYVDIQVKNNVQNTAKKPFFTEKLATSNLTIKIPILRKNCALTYCNDDKKGNISYGHEFGRITMWYFSFPIEAVINAKNHPQ